MALQQDDVQSWSPSAPPERSEAAALLSELSAHRPAARVPAPRTPSAAEPSGTTRVAPAVPAAGPALALPPENPTSPTFSADGRFWWDGTRWTPTTALERTTVDGGQARRHWSPALVWAGVVAALLAVLGLAALPVLWGARAGGSDEVLQTALLGAVEAQQMHLVDHGRFAPDTGALELYLVRVGGLPDVAVEVRASDDMTFCVQATADDGTSLWVSESGAVTSTACA